MYQSLSLGMSRIIMNAVDEMRQWTAVCYDKILRASVNTTIVLGSCQRRIFSTVDFFGHSKRVIGHEVVAILIAVKAVTDFVIVYLLKEGQQRLAADIQASTNTSSLFAHQMLFKTLWLFRFAGAAHASSGTSR